MAQREVSIKVRLRPEGFLSGMRRMGTTTRTTGRKMGRALSQPIAAGMKSAKASIGSMVSTLKGAIKTAATFGGAFALGGLIKGAVTAEQAYIALGNTLSNFSGETIEAAQAQKVIEAVAGRTKGSLDALRTSANQLAGVVAKGGLAGFEDALQRADLQARRLNIDSQLIARTYSRLITKGVAESAEEAELLVERMNLFGRTVLGIDPDEAIDPNDMAEFAAFTNQAGLNMTQALNLVSAVGGEAVKDMGQAVEFVEEFGNVLKDTQALGDLRKKLKISPEDLNSSQTAVENLVAVLETAGPKGVESLLSQFGNERTKAALRELIGEGLIVDIEKGKKGTKEQLKIRAKEIQEMLADVGDATEDRARIEEVNAKLTQTAAANFQDALNKVEVAFGKPKMIAAIDSLADNLPKFAEGLATVVDFVVNNPLLSAGGFVGAKVGLSAASSFAGSAASSAAGGVAGIARQQIQKRAVGTAIQAGLAGLAGNSGAAFAASAAASSKWAVAGTAMAGAAGPLIAIAIAGAVAAKAIDVQLERERGTVESGDVSLIAARAAGTKNLATKREAFQQLKARRQEISQGPGALTSGLSDLAEFFGAVDPGEGLDAASANAKAMRIVTDEMVALRDEIALLEEKERKAGSASEKLATAANKAATALGKIAPPGSPGGGGGPERGPAGQPGVKPGASPQGPGR